MTAADFGAGKPLAPQALRSGFCARALLLLMVFLKQQICYWTDVLFTGRQLSDARLFGGVYFSVLPLGLVRGDRPERPRKV